MCIRDSGMTLVAHEPFESAESAIRKESDIFSDSIIVETASSRIRVADKMCIRDSLLIIILLP